MREIKFRGWNENDQTLYIWEEIQSWEEDFGCHVYDQLFRGDHWICEEYTGLKDKNGAEIYEGDVVRIPEMYDLNKYKVPEIKSLRGKIGFVFKSSAGFNVRHVSSLGENEGLINVIHKGYGMIDNYDLWNYQRVFEVIGNIHENPELLEEGK